MFRKPIIYRRIVELWDFSLEVFSLSTKNTNDFLCKIRKHAFATEISLNEWLLPLSPFGGFLKNSDPEYSEQFPIAFHG